MRKQSQNSPGGLSLVHTHSYTWGFLFQVSFWQLQPQDSAVLSSSTDCPQMSQQLPTPNPPMFSHPNIFTPPRTGTKPRGLDSPEAQQCNLQRSAPALPPCPGEEEQTQLRELSWDLPATPQVTEMHFPPQVSLWTGGMLCLVSEVPKIPAFKGLGI